MLQCFKRLQMASCDDNVRGCLPDDPGSRFIKARLSADEFEGTALARDADRPATSMPSLAASSPKLESMGGEIAPSPTSEDRPVASNWSPSVAQGQLLAAERLRGVTGPTVGGGKSQDS